MKEDKEIQISPAIESAISEIEEEDSARLSTSNIGFHFDQIVGKALGEINKKRDEFIEDFISNPENTWRKQFEESASKGYGGLQVSHSSFKLYERRALIKLGFRFTEENKREEVWWPTEKE